MCTGKSASEKTQERNYQRELIQRRVQWDTDRNIWNMKIANYEFRTDENVLASSRQIGAINRKYALEIEKYFADNQEAYVDLISEVSINEGGRSRTFGRKAALRGMNAQSKRNANLRRAGIAQTEELNSARRQLMTANNRALSERGFGPVPGVTPAQPAKAGFMERTLPVVGSVVGIATGVASLFSDRKLKENIEEVGISPMGYKIYEFNYKGGDVRFRGAMAQDVLKKNPMAVGIDQNYLTVDYQQIDIAMEVV